MRRPSPEFEPADGRSPFSCFIGGDRASDCMFHLFGRVFVIKSRDLF
jgi:hypothetical protein